MIPSPGRVLGLQVGTPALVRVHAQGNQSMGLFHTDVSLSHPRSFPRSLQTMGKCPWVGIKRQTEKKERIGFSCFSESRPAGHSRGEATGIWGVWGPFHSLQLPWPPRRHTCRTQTRCTVLEGEPGNFTQRTQSESGRRARTPALAVTVILQEVAPLWPQRLQPGSPASWWVPPEAPGAPQRLGPGVQAWCTA